MGRVDIGYSKLPGHRRGLFRGASLWLAPDYLLSVQSMRVREEYKRFHLRDVQAIVVAERARFHLSTRSIALAAVWLAAYAAASIRFPAARPALWAVGACLIAAWIYVSGWCSCTCRIYTAVSRDDLPSIYRTWTARKFLAQVASRIAAVQGGMPPDWADRVENLRIGPVEAAPAGGSATPEAARKIARPRTIVTDLLVATLFADALVNALTLHSAATPAQWASYTLSFLKMATATLVLVQRHRGELGPAMPRLAIAVLIVMGLFFYARPVVASIQQGNNPVPLRQDTLGLLPFTPLIRWADIVSSGVLGLIGGILTLRASGEAETA